jgi:predicted transcriptional regulator
MEKGKLFEATMLLLLLFLCALLYVSIAGGSPGAGDRWSLSSVSPTAYTFAGDGGMVYLFDGNDVYAVRDGSLQWKYTVPAEWSAINKWELDMSYDWIGDSDGYNYGFGYEPGMIYTGPVFSSGGDTLYMYAKQGAGWNDTWSIYGVEGSPGGWNASLPADALLAIRDGRLLWERQAPAGAIAYCGPDTASYDDVSLYATGDRLYFYQAYNVTVLGNNGSILYTVGNVSYPPAVDEDGHMYVVTSVSPLADKAAIDEMYTPPFGNASDSLARYFPTFMIPSGTVEAYDAGGTLLWRTDLGKPAIREIIDPSFGMEHRTLPLYGNGVLYVPFADGVAALGRDGSMLWSVTMDRSVNLYEKMPYDSKGHVYLTDDKYGYLVQFPLIPTLRDYVEQALIADRKVYIVSEGAIAATANESYMGRAPLAATDGVAYYVTSAKYDADRPSVDSLLPRDVAAVNLSSGDLMWTLRLPPGTVNTVTMEQSNLNQIFSDEYVRDKTASYNRGISSIPRDQLKTYRVAGDAQWVNMLPYGGDVYVSYYSYNYEYPSGYKAWARTPGIDDRYLPAVFNRSRCDYVAGVIALDNSGRVLWQRPTGAYVTGMTANNSTIYYSMSNGGLSATDAGIATGFAILASAYLLLRFFLVGAVSRARNRLEHNENRNLVLGQIRERPGGTMYEIARALDMNIGTLRYHLLILGVNHRVATHRDGKFVRFFSPASAYSQEEREIISLLRREPVRRLVSTLREQPGISNAELAVALGLSDPAISNYMRELSVRGIVAKEATADGRISYAIMDEHADRIAATLQRSEKA